MAVSEITNKHIVKYDKTFKFFFVDEAHYKLSHPVSDYYLNPIDISVNVNISLKWAEWAYVFFYEISKEISVLGEEYKYENLISGSIQDKMTLGSKEEEHIILIDNLEIKNESDFVNTINNVYSSEIFTENTKLNFKLKINLREYHILSGFLFPTLGQFI